MPEIKIPPFVRRVAIALIFFVIGRAIVLQMGDNSTSAIVALIIIFYAVWWILYRRKRGNK